MLSGWIPVVARSRRPSVRLQWSAPGKIMADNRRSSTRHTVSIASKLTINNTAHNYTMVNLSLGGALVTGAKLAMGQRVQINFAVPTMAEAIDVGATVRWTDGSGVGLQFDGLRARDVWALNEYFKQLS
jgi:PilZ domain-containing protein